MSRFELQPAVLDASFPSRLLLDSIIQPRTLQLYCTATAKFIRWYRIQADAFISVRHIDERLCDYVTLLYSKGAPMSLANETVFGLLHFMPELTRDIFRTRRALKAWKKNHITRSHPPMSWQLLCVFAIQMAAVGWYEEALATLISYDGYFRTASELLSLRVKDFHYSNLPNQQHSNYICRLRHTKTGKNKLVTLTMPALGEALIAHIRVSNLVGRDLIFNFSAAQYRFRFRMVVEMMGWGTVGFVPHSLRHGHASDDFINGVPIESIMTRGRWKSIDSTRHYIQSGRVHLIRGRLAKHLPVLTTYSPTYVLALLLDSYSNSLSQ
jgi:integrase